MTLPTWPCRPTPITIVRAHGLVIEVYPAPPRRPDLAAYGHADRRPGRLRGALAELAGSGHRDAAPPAPRPAPATTAQVAAMDLLRQALEHRDAEIARAA